ncbi:ATP-dependent DNA helicase [Iodidimonas sp. SYSU 1G8]|uniref:ATP-dependent DNA helicase n=1 Tax=Iodidimonas sp. SYSU 1G8 TaxID=3133967 RepID=UPI0031FF01DF
MFQGAWRGARSILILAAMSSLEPTPPLPDAPALAVGFRGGVLVTADGEVTPLGLGEAAVQAARGGVLVCHEPAVSARLGAEPLTRVLDVLDLYAFTRPASFCIPTPGGLAAALGLPAPGPALEDQAVALHRAAARLLAQLADPRYPDRPEAQRVAQTMARAGWVWGRYVTAALGAPLSGGDAGTGLDVWRRLPQWEDEAPRPPPDDYPVGGAEVQERLTALRGRGAEDRESQRDYAGVIAAAFAPREIASAPNAVLAEAGTGIGKTLGYIAPSSVWAQRNKGAVWLSTYTKNLQRQLDQELDRLFPDRREKARKVVVRKGRENYLCLLNLEEAVGRAQMTPDNLVRLALIVRWARYTRDGDMVGGDLPAWLLQRIGPGRASGLTDRRGECVYSACAHWRTCFIEHSSRKARGADLVIANHALVMIRAALYGSEEDRPTRYVFDEGHHLFDAADSAFSAHLSGLEAVELRRWVRGPEAGGRKGRARGIEARIGDLLADHPESEKLMREAIRAAAALPAEGWLGRIASGSAQGAAETFLASVRTHVYARAQRPDDPYTLEAATHTLTDALRADAAALEQALAELAVPMQQLAKVLGARLGDEAEELESSERTRLEAARNGIARRIEGMVQPWRAMLRDLEKGTAEGFVDWFSVERGGQREYDVGLHRHWIDPTKPFSDVVLAPAHGVVVTSATLRDEVAEDDDGWRNAEVRTGFNHLVLPARRSSHASPFDYAAQSRVLVVRDVKRTDAQQVAGAYRALFEASGGGALGLFTAINRLRDVYGRIAAPLAQRGIGLHAQHVDAFDPGTLIDIFRAEANSCLLGTDAVRDGVDVPGEALRLIVFDRVPWPRPSILHRARRDAFGGNRYDDMLTRLKLKQAFGRLIRRAGDRGLFVMLDSAMPSRLLTAFPEGVAVDRVGLADAVEIARGFFAAETVAG